MEKSSALFLTAALACASAAASDWPSLRHFDSGHLYRVALPMGGIGTGTVSLGGRGELRDWEIMNVPNKGVNGVDCDGASCTFFAINLKGAGHSSTSALQGPMYPYEYLNAEGHPVPQGGLPRFSEASFDAAFPFGVAHLSDPTLPVRVDVKGFSPFVPGDSEASQLPVAYLEYEVENTGGEPLEVSVAAFVRNIVGNTGEPVGWTWKSLSYSQGENDNVTEYREEDGVKGLFCWSRGVDPASAGWGSFALATDDGEAAVSYREASLPNDWNRTILEWWDDFSADGELGNLPREGNIPDGGLCLKKTVPAGEKRSFRFAIAWRFPNRFAWSQKNIGNWYCGLYEDGWDAMKKTIGRRAELEKRTLEFTASVAALDMPAEIKEAALSNLAVLKSQTVFREGGGHLMGWEGIFDHYGSCAGSCTHVWNYENAIASLFPDLSRTMREVEFVYSLKEDGKMNFRAGLPLEEGGDCGVPFPAADGQLGCIMKVYRDWKICGDDGWLKGIWPRVRLALEYAWKDWDADRDGLMEGGQHNTMDVFYFGPNPQMEFWYMGALRAATEMAIAMGENDFALECDDIFRRASKAVDEKLFNGDYYEHIIAPGHENDPYQLGPGCLVDQLVGQQMAHLWDLGDLAKKENLRKTCESIMRWNFLDDFSRHFNNMRVYAAGHESGLLMASWPKGRLEVPFPYFGEVMTGFEYVAAAEMIFQGMDAEAVKVVKAIRDRHDGAKRNPFSEPECGHHYARSMASWNCLLAWQKMHGQATGFVFDHAHNYGLDDYVDSVVTIDDIRNAPPADALYRDPGADIEARVEDVMKYMTMEEKAAVIHAGGSLHTTGIPRIGLNVYRFTDGASGIRAEKCPGVTYFPVGIAWAAAWDEELAYLSGRAQGEEVRGAYGHGRNYEGSCRMLLGPGGNLARTPLGARNFEYLGEDPVLVGKTASAFCRGLQSVKVSPSMKHFCLND
ncbi:MAG: hypothetical protein ILO34_08600, partial [Kiritimatiellae bacterium]|nr:hypothetical protein [Kiritimatiellia bacterium]